MRSLPKITKYTSLQDATEYYKEREDAFNIFEFMYVGDTVLIRNYYNGQFAWLIEYFETTKEDFDQIVIEEL